MASSSSRGGKRAGKNKPAVSDVRGGKSKPAVSDVRGGKSKPAGSGGGKDVRGAAAPFDPFRSKKAIAMMAGDELATLSLSFGQVVGDPVAFRALLDEHGVAIVTDVVDADECRQLEAAWRRSLTALCGDSDPEALVPGSQRTGFTPLHALPHSEFAWRCRLHANVRRLFACIYETDELCCSVDLPFYLPASAGLAPPSTEPAPHADQNLHVPGSGDCLVYQAIVYVWDATSTSGSSTVVCPGSHRSCWPRLMRDELARSLAARRDHFVRVQYAKDAQLRGAILADYLAAARRAPVPAGGVLVWNSRVLHQGYTPGPRLAQPVVWEPKSRRRPDALARKVEYCLRGYPTTHWAHLGDLHHVCWRLKGADAKNAVGPAAIPAHASTPSAVPLHDRWLRTYAALDDAVVDSDELNELVDDAHKDAEFGSVGPSLQKLINFLKPEIVDAL